MLTEHYGMNTKLKKLRSYLMQFFMDQIKTRNLK